MGTRKKKSKGVAIVIMLVIIAILAGIAALLFVQGKLSKINRVSTATDKVDVSAQSFETDEDIGPDTVAPEDVTWAEPLSAETAEGVTNILLIGQDARAGEGRQRSDTMVICSLNTDTGKITMCSLMRDLYVPIPGYEDNRINAAYAFGGMELLDQVVERDFGVKIDGNFAVDLEGFLNAMGAVGPLEIELTAEEAAYLNGNPGIGTGTDVASESWNLTPGLNTLTPAQALGYARIRYVGNSDYERTERQRRVLTAAFNKLSGSDLPTLLRASDSILPCLTTDLGNGDIIKLITTVKMKDLKLSPTSYRIPADGTFSSENIRGMAVLVPDLQANSALLREYLYGTAQ